MERRKTERIKRVYKWKADQNQRPLSSTEERSAKDRRENVKPSSQTNCNDIDDIEKLVAKVFGANNIFGQRLVQRNHWTIEALRLDKERKSFQTNGDEKRMKIETPPPSNAEDDRLSAYLTDDEGSDEESTRKTKRRKRHHHKSQVRWEGFETGNASPSSSSSAPSSSTDSHYQLEPLDLSVYPKGIRKRLKRKRRERQRTMDRSQGIFYIFSKPCVPFRSELIC